MHIRLLSIVLAFVALCALTAGSGNHHALMQGSGDTLRFEVPTNFPSPVYRFTNNPVTEAGFALGRRLFYDPVLSVDHTISCASCHQPFAAFAQLDHDLSHGVDNCEGTRNTPALFNLVWQKAFMWDGGVNHIELSPLNALTNSCEMANNLDTIVNRLNNDAVYRAMFKNAFASRQINSQQLLRALAQFTGMMVSANSRYDKYIRKEAGGVLSETEMKGYALFTQQCASCHTEPLFTDLSYRNNGLDVLSADAGRDTITGLVSDKGKFKVPSLRNVALTAPYMHDGRIGSLAEVLAHYDHGVQPHPNLDAAFRKNERLGITLSKTEQQEIIAFLKTLTDTSFINDKRFQPVSVQ